MPGPVIAGHADLETQCTNCHARFARQRQRDLCVACHENVGDDVAAGTGFHGLSPEVAGEETCAGCHEDHLGRDADIVRLDREAFNHDFTDFPLHDSHQDVECEDCHGEQPFHEAVTTCFGCHQEDDQHRGNLGESCADCHFETTWDDTHFDHEMTADYALTGGHADISCVSCHVDEQYENTPTTCIACHREDDSHMGDNGTECQDCHTTNDWKETLFDHFDVTGFALTFGHSGLECEACHSGNKFEEETPDTCYGCHMEDDSHDGINGTECADCHSTRDWTDTHFDHARDADFPLNGAHADLDCQQCHMVVVTDSKPPTDCFGCHEADDPHEDQLGEACEACHGEVEWTLDVRFDHDLTRFPLLGKHAETECEDCHETEAFLDAPEECVDCHLEDDTHEKRLGPDCALCHNPTDWLAWQFDHGEQTRFVLDGAHDGLQCEGCHERPANETGDVAVSMTCGECHRSDDIHRGEFGTDCERCHSTTSFADVKALR